MVMERGNYMLTKKQLALLQFIDLKTNTYGISPSFEEMREALHLKSKSGIHRLITALEERGFIRRLPHRARALEVIKAVPKLPETSKIEEKTAKVQPFRVKQTYQENMRIPLVGQIAAGIPIEAIEDNTREVTVPSSMVSGGDHFALQVKGESMINAGINHDDIVIIKQQSNANNGDIVVALVAEQEATLKKIKISGSIIELEAANPKFKTQKWTADEVKIQGRLVGLLRTY